MCQLTAPPTVFLAGPLQAPFWWLFIGALAFFLWAVPIIYRKYLRQHPSALYRRVAVAVLAGALVLACTSAVLLGLVAAPSGDALVAWQDSQYATLDASHCPIIAYSAVHATYNRQLNGPIATLDSVGNVFMLVSLGTAFIWFYWLARRTRAEPARQ
jgi:hypothetical protein